VRETEHAGASQLLQQIRAFFRASVRGIARGWPADRLMARALQIRTTFSSGASSARIGESAVSQ
jgi:hypothetical protein